jgi:hypothetical protein
LLLPDRKDFLKGDWPLGLRERVAAMTQRLEAGSRKWAPVIFGKEGHALKIHCEMFGTGQTPICADHKLRASLECH